MSNFILEIFSEEIPALMQKGAAENFAKIALEILNKNGLNVKESQLKSMISPRRLALLITNLEEKQKVPAVKKVGPRIDADKKAVEGFLKSCGLASLDLLEKNDTNFIFNKAESEISAADLIKNSLPQILQKMQSSWPKLMRWDILPNQQARWIRPIRNILCMFDEKVIDIEFAGLKSNNQTFGHFLNNAEILQIADADSYEKILAENYVIVDQKERKSKIISQIKQIKSDLQLDSIDDEEKSALFDEVVGLCEFPTALLASIDKKFMNLPAETLILTLKLNQKYICLKDKNGNLAPQFIFISNAIINSSNQNKIISDNEKLVRARLSDVQFFIEEDLKKPLIARVSSLENVVFHQKLGSLHNKISRLDPLAKALSMFVPHCDLSLVEKSVALAKADLGTKIVAELPELQGKMGSFYAKMQNEDEKIATAIYEHYLPLGPNSELPKTPLGIVLSIADKIDSIVGFFLVDEKPSSSKDPFALRRAALGIIRISFQYNVAIPIRVLVEKSLNIYPAKLLKSYLSKEGENFFKNKKNLVEEIVKFFIERLKVYLKENHGLRPDIINAVIDEYSSNLDAHKYFDILYLAKKIKFLDEFVRNPLHAKIITLYKRSSNILEIEEKKDQKTYVAKAAILGLKNHHELSLYKALKKIEPKFKKSAKQGDFIQAFNLLSEIEEPLSQFFDNVIVNDQNETVRQKRLLLLSKIRALFVLVADLSKIEI